MRDLIFKFSGGSKSQETFQGLLAGRCLGNLPDVDQTEMQGLPFWFWEWNDRTNNHWSTRRINQVYLHSTSNPPKHVIQYFSDNLVHYADMKCLNSSTTDISKNITNNIYSMAQVVAMRAREWKREPCAHTAQTQSLTLLYKTSVYSHVLWC